ncbi:MAG: hypothetical protein NT011_01825 [Kiritimatiellaeota bacterium]|nr:hypothetical protein [Kiritimatiellota bacterium]
MNIKEKLKIIAELYPQPRIENTKKRLNAFWQKADIGNRFPYTIRRREIPLGKVNYSMDKLSHEESLHIQLDEIIRKAHLPDDYVPSLITSSNCYLLALECGCELKEMDGLMVAEPRYSDLAAALTMSAPDLTRPKSLWRLTRERIAFFIDKTEGQLPLHPPDPQGPLSTATQILNQEEFFCALSLAPKKVRQFLEICTEITADFISAIQKAIPTPLMVPIHCHPYLWRPANGFALSEDMLGVLGPDYFGDFGVPCLKRIAAQFGPLVLHSCGNCASTIRIFNDAANYLAALNLAQTPMEEICRSWPAKALINISPADWADLEMIKRYKESAQKWNIPTIFNICTVGTDITQTAEHNPAVYQQIAEILKITEKSGSNHKVKY